jgi:SAM-dependent methyltransferase
MSQENESRISSAEDARCSGSAERPDLAGDSSGLWRHRLHRSAATIVVMRDPPSRRALPSDYDRDPDRFRLARTVLRRHALAPDVHERVARRLLAEGLTPVLDVGCGEGELAGHLPADAWVGVDSSAEMLARAPGPHHRADATSLPFPDASFGSVALLYVLYHLEKPIQALAETRRVLRSRGLVAVAAPSRDDSPELADALPRGRLTFDAELAPELLAEQFAEVEVERWDAQLLELPTRTAVRDYLIGKGVERLVAEAKAETIAIPLRVTKRGALAFGRKA